MNKSLNTSGYIHEISVWGSLLLSHATNYKIRSVNWWENSDFCYTVKANILNVQQIVHS